MGTKVFKTVDKRYLIAALSLLTHSKIDTYESTFGLKTNPRGNRSKEARAVDIIDHIFKQQDADSVILAMLDFVFIEQPWRVELDDVEEYRRLDEKVLRPRGVVLADDGFAIRQTPAPDPSQGGGDVKFVWDPPTSVEVAGIGAYREGRVRGVSVESEPVPTTSNRKVFVVHGRDNRPVHVLDQFLTFCGLHMMSWPEARSLTKKPQPTTYEIVAAGITNAAAVIVIFSPDDLGRVKDDFAESEDDPDRKLSGQARQNVILEAGMAFGMAPDRTIFVKSDKTRPLSDIDGFNWVTMDGSYESRADLIGRLRDSKAPVNHKPNLLDRTAGNFSVS